ncbi:helix-turn-helix domain-containing protein [Halobacillus sp. H74]|uniref:helix-turn-helix domain-containing protein n=1 Tax=Halobacillus sp. H74 TaxID=3457436 RepID=UPI003FCC4716
MIFSKRMKEMRKKCGLTMDSLAEKLGLRGKSTIAGYENGSRHPSQEKLKEIAIIFNTSTDYLLGITDNPHPPNDDLNNLAQILESNKFHFNGRELDEEDLDLLMNILERISKKENQKLDINKQK